MASMTDCAAGYSWPTMRCRRRTSSASLPSCKAVSASEPDKAAFRLEKLAHAADRVVSEVVLVHLGGLAQHGAEERAGAAGLASIRAPAPSDALVALYARDLTRDALSFAT